MRQCERLIILALVSLQVNLIVGADLVAPEGFCTDLPPGHYPFEGDCNGFIYCEADGTGTAGRCIDDLHFKPGANPGEGVCTYPDLAGCDPNAGGNTTTCAEGDFWEERVEQTCNRYIRCLNGVTEERQCSGDLHWDSATQQCTTPELSDCPYPICSENPTPGEIEKLPHPTDCTMYYICMDQEPIQQNCAPGQHFDRVNKWCTTPEEAGCELGSGPAPTDPPATEAPGEPTEAPGEPTEAPGEPTEAPGETTETPEAPTEPNTEETDPTTPEPDPTTPETTEETAP